MNQHEGVWWNVIDTLSGMAIGVIGVVGAVMGWLNNKFSKVEDRMATLEQDFTGRNHAAETQIAKLQAYHESNIRRLDTIEDTTQRIDGKLDRLIDNLSNRGRHE
jgi:hypothetical protein